MLLYRGPGEVEYRMDGTDYGPLWTDRYPIALVAHTTETPGLPGYRNGTIGPQITIATRERRVYQHVGLDRRSGALRGTKKVHDLTGVWTVMNEKAVNVEIIGYSDRSAVLKLGGGRRWVGEFTDDEYEFLADVFAYLKTVLPIGDGIHAMPSGQTWRYGMNSPYRLGAREWEAFTGLTAHGGIFGQDHWDTGVLDLPRIWTGVLARTKTDEELDDFLEDLLMLSPEDLARSLTEEQIDELIDANVIKKAKTASGRHFWKVTMRQRDTLKAPEWKEVLREVKAAALVNLALMNHRSRK